MEDRVSFRNPNLCLTCVQMDWMAESTSPDEEIPMLALAEVSPALASSPSPSSLNEVPSELRQLIEMDEPSVIECLEAELAAKKAIAEVAAREVKALEQRLSSVARRQRQT